MQVLEKKVLFPHQPGRAPICGFALYVSATEPILCRRFGWEVGNDVHDDFLDSISYDNGVTWGEPRPSLSNRPVDGGYMVFVENAAIFLAEHNRLVTFTDQKFEPSLDNYDNNYSASIQITVSEPLSDAEDIVTVSDFGMRQGIYVSFCAPTTDAHGRVLVPVQWQKEDTDGSMRAQGFTPRDDMPDIMLDVWDVGLLIGAFDSEGTLQWRVGSAVPCAFEKSSRGMCEGTVIELLDGRLAMILRGSNAAWPGRPSYKWLSFSDDGGETWSEAEPLLCDDGSLLESSATGSALIRSDKTGKLYWIGNLCLRGERANGNWPRTPLYIAEVQEEPFALRSDTITVIDEQGPGEDQYVQMSNFRFYQERDTGDVMLHLTRYGERGSEDLKWMEADSYQYRIAID